MSPAQTLGKYRLVRRIGVGGMAEVFEAVAEGTAGFSKRVALKVLLPSCQREPEIVGMFIDEATLAAKLDHPNIVSVHDFGQAEGSHYMAMEYVDGWDLARLIQASRRSARPFSVGGAAHVVRELCRALDHIHRAEQQVVHRDVTPHNVFVTRRGQVKLGDFGIARSAARQARTAEGQIKGKLPYLAPEQVTGESVSPRTDVYAAGLILFELLAGRRLIIAEREIDLIQAAQSPPAIDLSSRPEAAVLEAVLRQALERHPTMRHPSAAALAADLDAYLGRHPVDAETLAELVGQLEQEQPEEQALRVADMPPAGPSPVRTRLLPQPGGGRRGWRVGVVVVALAAVGLGLVVLTNLGADPASPVDAGGSVDRSPAPSLPQRARDSGTERGIPDARFDTEQPEAKIHRRPVSVSAPRRPGPAPDARPPVVPDAGPSTADAPAARRDSRLLRGELDRLGKAARSGGLWPGDDAGVDRLASSVRADLKAGRTEQAAAALGQLRERIEAFRIDRTFVKAKMARLDRAIAAARLDPARQRSVAAASQRILVLVMEQRLVEASRLMSETQAGILR